MDLETFIRQTQESDLLRFSTAGSVDDGKSTLIGRLLSDCKSIYEDHLAAVHRDSLKLNREEPDLALLMDGLKAEREQGITIDVAYRYFSTPRRRFIIADTPGHEQYTRNMATGASTANLAIVLIDARNGVLTQSKRHGFIASLLGIPHVVVAVNKMDLVHYNERVYRDICADYGEFVSKLSIPDIAFIPISALRGDNVVARSEHMPWYAGVPLLTHLESVQIAGDRNLIDFRFPVQYVNRPNQDFRGFCGTVASGVVRKRDPVVVLPSGRTTRIKSILTFDGELEYAFPPQSVTLCLEDEVDVSRGDLLAHPGNLPHVERTVECMLVWMHESPLRLNRPYWIKHTTRFVRGAFSELKYKIEPDDLHRRQADGLGLNEIGRATLELFRPLACDEYSRNRNTGNIIVVDIMSNATVGAGVIIERAGHRAGIALAAGGGAVAAHLGHEESDVTPADRERVLGQRPRTVWLTGLSGSGKSTIARQLEKRLTDDGHACTVLDGDNIRHGLNRDLGFSAEHRTENIRRIAEVAKLMNDAGLLVITAFISPYREDRRAVRDIVGPDRFIEVFVDTPLDVCESRDPKGLYAKARSGAIASFTGISAPYEPPEHPDLRLETDRSDPAACVDLVLETLKTSGAFPR